MENMLNMILAEQKGQGDLLHQLIHAVAATNVKITEMDDRIAKMDERITQTNEKVTELNGKVTSIENKLDSVLEEVKEIKVKMATKHDLE